MAYKNSQASTIHIPRTVEPTSPPIQKFTKSQVPGLWDKIPAWQIYNNIASINYMLEMLQMREES